MKKVLAIALALVMALSMFGIAASAEGQTYADLPVFPAQEEGRIQFALDSITFDNGASPAGTYSLPLYIVSNYPTDFEVGYVELGCNIMVSGDIDSVKITDIQIDPAIEAMGGYAAIDNGYGESTYSIEPEWAHIAFKVNGAAILNQAKLKVATVTVEIADTYAFESSEEGTLTDTCLMITPYEFMWVMPEDGYYSDSGLGGAIFDKDAVYGEGPEAAIELQEGVGNDGDLFYTYCYIAEEPATPDWKIPLIEWFRGILDQFFQIFETIHNFIQEVIGVLEGLV